MGSPRGRAAWGSLFRITAPGRATRDRRLRMRPALDAIPGTLCAEWGAREVAEYASAPVSPLLPPIMISGARVRLRQHSIQLRLQLSRHPRASHGEFSRFM